MTNLGPLPWISTAAICINQSYRIRISRRSALDSTLRRSSPAMLMRSQVWSSLSGFSVHGADLECIDMSQSPQIGMEPNMRLELKTLRSRPELRSRVGHIIDLATQVMSLEHVRNQLRSLSEH
ncbi:uncharacterized protein LOC144300198 [Canis aureus]